MKMAIVSSTAPGNVWTSDEFAVLVRDTVANFLGVGLDDLLKADEAEVVNAVMRVCSEINGHARRECLNEPLICLCPVVSVTGVCGRLLAREDQLPSA
jgi:hypothetical protein